jgi:hypothetical protein
MTAFSGITQDLYAVPPRGVTISTVRTGDEVIQQWTYLCEVDGCFAMAYSKKSPESAKSQTTGHACPAPLRRGVTPMGKSLLENMWDTADEAMDAYKAGTFYLEEGCAGDNLKYYIMAIAEMITLSARPYFRITEDVLRELQRRWKMRQGQLPFSPTPSYRWNPMPIEYKSPGKSPEDLRKLADHQDALYAHRSTQKRLPAGHPKKAASVPPTRNFTPDERCLIRDSVHKNNVPVAELAKMFDVSEERIRTIAGDGTPVSSPPVLFGGLFG